MRNRIRDILDLKPGIKKNSNPGWKNSNPGWKTSDPGSGINILDRSATLFSQDQFLFYFMTKKKVFDQKSHEMSSKIPTKDIQAPAEASSSTIELFNNKIS